MANTIFFHIGLHKTATGWLQRQLFPSLPLPIYRTRKFDKIGDLAADPSTDAIIISHEGLGGRISDSKAPGDTMAIFSSTIARIADLPIEGKVLIGFREHAAWINSAYAQRGKKSAVTPVQYRDSYVLGDLLWMDRVALCDRHGLKSFQFLYEEFGHDPITLVADLCKFLETPMPGNTAELLARRENPSPRTARGFRVSRVAHRIARALGGLPGVDAKRLRASASKLGAGCDSAAGPPLIVLKEAETERLRDDWSELVGSVALRRGRDFSLLSAGAKG